MWRLSLTRQTEGFTNNLELEKPKLCHDLGIVVRPICKCLWVTIMTSFTPLQSSQRAGTWREQWKVKVHLRWAQDWLTGVSETREELSTVHQIAKSGSITPAVQWSVRLWQFSQALQRLSEHSNPWGGGGRCILESPNMCRIPQTLKLSHPA